MMIFYIVSHWELASGRFPSDAYICCIVFSKTFSIIFALILLQSLKLGVYIIEHILIVVITVPQKQVLSVSELCD